MKKLFHYLTTLLPLSMMLIGVVMAAATAPKNLPPTARPTIQWLLTADGERRGFALASDLTQDGPAWTLLARRSGPMPLSPLTDLIPPLPIGFAVNGGFWNEELFPVGVCAGAQGIHAARAHQWGLALAGDRAWIGPLTPVIALSPASAAVGESAISIALNPRPMPTLSPSLIDFQTYPYNFRLARPMRVVRLDPLTSGPLAFNTQRQYRVGAVADLAVNSSLTPPAPGALLWLIPASSPAGAPPESSPAPGQLWRLDLRLMPVEGEVRLATCGWPRLLSHGVPMAGLNDKREPRTAVGIDTTGRRLWLICLMRGRDGQPGASLSDAAQTLRDLGAAEALNLDGGNSTSAWSSRYGAELQSLFPLRVPIHHALFLSKDVIKKPSQP